MRMWWFWWADLHCGPFALTTASTETKPESRHACPCLSDASKPDEATRPMVSPVCGLAAPLWPGAEMCWILLILGGTSIRTAQLQSRAEVAVAQEGGSPRRGTAQGGWVWSGSLWHGTGRTSSPASRHCKN